MKQREEKSSACTSHGDVTIKLNSCCTSNLAHPWRLRPGQSGWVKVGGEVVENFPHGFRRQIPNPTVRPSVSEDEFSNTSH